tara:strand:+ start:535 stop:984 length:450 start_codon:yes stop_codon:yes gene_type:complete
MSSDLKDLNLFKHYRIIRKWAAKISDLKGADIELFFYLEAINYFTKQDFKKGVHSYSWDNRRWNRLLKEDWIVVWRERNRTTQKYNIYKLSFKGKQLLARIYRIILGEEEIPETTRNNFIMKRDCYSDKTLATAIINVNKDKFKNYANI